VPGTWTRLMLVLCQEHETTTIAVLLGMAAARRGSMDATVAKVGAGTDCLGCP